MAFDAVSSGTAEMGHGAAYYWKGKTEVAFSVVGPKQSRRVPSGLQQLR